MDAFHLGVRFTGQEGIDVNRDFTFLSLPDACPVRPEAGERQQWPAFVRSEPYRHLLAIDGVVFAERRERDQATVLDPKPPLLMRAAHVPDVSGATVRFHAKQSLEIDRLTLSLELLGSLLGGIQERLLGGRHAPSSHDDLTTVGRVANDRRREPSSPSQPIHGCITDFCA